MTRSFFLALVLASFASFSAFAFQPGTSIGAGTNSYTPLERKRLIRLADAGDPKASFIVGYMYESGDGTSRDPVKARLYYQQAEMGGILSATYRLGIVEPDPKLAQAQFKKAADRGYVPAMTAYAQSLEGTNDALAGQWYSKACSVEKNPDPEACYQSGLRSERQGRPESQTRRLFDRAATEGHKLAEEKVGDYYVKDKKYDRAYYFYQRAAIRYSIGSDQQRLIDKRDAAGEHLSDDAKRKALEAARR